MKKFRDTSSKRESCAEMAKMLKTGAGGLPLPLLNTLTGPSLYFKLNNLEKGVRVWRKRVK